MPVLLNEVQRLIEENISPDAVQAMNAAVKHLALLNFLAGALQVMPEESCCDTASKIQRLVDCCVNQQVKTQAYLTLEVLYASRRLSSFGDHITVLLRHMLNSPEMPESQTIRGAEAGEKFFD